MAAYRVRIVTDGGGVMWDRSWPTSSTRSDLDDYCAKMNRIGATGVRWETVALRVRSLDAIEASAWDRIPARGSWE